MKKWKYTYYDEEAGQVPIDKPYKEPFIWSDTQPDADYVDVTTEEESIIYEAGNYPERRRQGVEFSDVMNARLVILGKGIADEELRGTVRKYLYEMFKHTRLEVFEGLWISAKREIEKVKPNPVLQSLVYQYDLPVNQEALIQEITARIDIAINDLYDE